MRPINLSRRQVLATTSLAAATVAAAKASPVFAQLAPRSDRPPNIICIVADDLGYSDLSSYGAQGYRTPVLDQLASDGVRFRHAYANAPICSPTRVALLTGRYQGRFKAGLGEPGVDPGDEIPVGTPTIASMLRAQGYRTALVGKWHLGSTPDHGPLRYGYDSFFGFEGGAADYFRHRSIRNGVPAGKGLQEGDSEVTREGYLTDVLADEAIKQIEAPSDKPLFLSLHFNAPHWPWEGPGDIQRSREIADGNDPSGGSLETYAEMMTSLDANIGRVLAALQARGMAENTMVVFTSDNGAERFSNSWPLVGYKGELLEGGIRVPLIIRWPSRVGAGRISDQVFISMDTVPTFLAAAGGAPAQTDGMNLLPQLTGEASPVNRTLFWRYKASEQAAVRDGSWKFVRIGGKEHLFDVVREPRERADKKDEQPQIFAALKAKWEEWNATMLPYPADSSSEYVASKYADRYPGPPQPAAPRSPGVQAE
jgi:arylsulfatase A-like enzyme